MKQARSNLALVTLGARVYAVGGFDGKQRLSSVEVFFYFYIYFFPCILALVTLGARVYAVGGFDGKQRLRSVEVFCDLFFYIFFVLHFGASDSWRL
jgi:predicted ABC-type sugar transport system permease subunit